VLVFLLLRRSSHEHPYPPLAVDIGGAIPPTDPAEVAAASFLARYNRNTLDAYRHDLRTFFQRAADRELDVLAATRPHIETYRASLEDRGLAPATIDRRLSTVCGFYRFAHIDGHIGSNPAQYVRRPKVHPRQGAGLDREELGRFLFTAERVDHDHAALAMLLGLNGLRSAKHVPPTSKISASSEATEHSRSSARATSLQPSRCHHESPGQSTWPSANATMDRSSDEPTEPASIDAPPTAGSRRLAAGPTSLRSTHTCSAPRSSWPPSTPAYLYEKSSSPHATPTPAPPPSTTTAAPTSTATPPTPWSPTSPPDRPPVITSHRTELDGQPFGAARSDRAASRRSDNQALSERVPVGGGTFPQVFKPWSKERRLPDNRQAILEAYVHELRDLDLDQLVRLVPTEPGFWNIPELDRNKAGVDLGVRALRPFESDGEICLVAEVRSRRRWYRVFIEGFVIGRDGKPRDLSDAEWEVWG